MMRRHYLAREDGFTLVEMIIVMALFIVIIIITANAFNTVLIQTKKVSKSEESNIEGVIGLEMFRHDLEQAGFGLFTEVEATPPDYDEAVGTRPATYNDSPGGIPRAIVAGNNITGDATVLSGTDYLAIKGTTLSRNSASQKWSYIEGIGSSKVWGTNDFVADDYVVAVRQKYVSGELQRKLIYSTASPGSFSIKYQPTAGDYADPFGPPSSAVQYYYYGVYYSTGSAPPIAPFNRTDYFVKRTSGTPTSCAPGAGVLYKSTMSQVDGSMTDIPILDCVADLQVVFGWDIAGNGLDTYTDADMSTLSTGLAWTPSLNTPSDVRRYLRLIKVYILAQDGGKDRSFVNTDTAMPVGIPGEANTLAKTIDLTGSNYQNYRWKLYRIIVKPKNII